MTVLTTRPTYPYVSYLYYWQQLLKKKNVALQKL